MATIVSILVEVLKTAIACYTGGLLSDTGDADPSRVFAQIRDDHEANPQRLRRRTARRIRGEATAMMSRDQALALADGVIEQALEADVDLVSVCCEAAGFRIADSTPVIPAPTPEVST